MMQASEEPSRNRSTRCKKHKTDTSSSVQRLLSMMSSSDSDNEETVSSFLDSIPKNPNNPLIKLIYVSRTHSQLKQVLGELAKINHENLKAVIVGGRSQLCINTHVNNHHGDLSEKCTDLLASEEKCPFWHEHHSVANVKALVDKLGLVQLVDIEEAVKEGKQCRACPYFTIKAIQQGVTITLCPYSMLFQDSEQSLKLDKNTIVVIDEAHNLQDFINQSETKSISIDNTDHVSSALQAYINKYGRRLSGLNLAQAQQLQFVIGNLHKFMTNVDSEFGQSMSVLEFMQSCSIDTINICKLVEYARASRLAHKLDISSPVLLFEIIAFILKLSEQSENGRILIIKDESEKILIKYVNVKASTVMEPIVTQSRAVILAGGTMSPLSDMIDGLFPSFSVHHHSFGHILPSDRFAVSLLSHGPTNQLLDCRLDNRSDAKMWNDIWSVIVNFCRITPGSITVFFASFPLLQQGLMAMPDAVDRIRQSRPLYIEERERGAAGVDAMLKDYSMSKSACMFAVIGGRLSEGVNLKDHQCRTMIIVGMPYLNEHDVQVSERVKYGGGSRYIHNQCMRKVNQTMGRALRHALDYAFIVLLDQRYERVKSDLPDWMQSSIQANSFPQAYTRAIQFFKRLTKVEKDFDRENTENCINHSSVN